MSEDSIKPIGVAIIGFGGMGGYHAQRLNSELDEFNLIGIFDVKATRQKAAEDSGIHAFASREALLSDPRVEVVTVATPNDLHKEIVIDALNHGKNVISEKPVTLSSADLEDMIAAAKRNGKLFTVHQNRRWDKDYLTVKKIIDENTLGRVFEVENRVHGSRGIPGDWRNKKAQGGGMLLDWGIHLLDQVLQLTEDRRLLDVYAQLTYITNEECDDGFRAFLRFENDLHFLVEVLTSNFIELPRWYLLGENGSAIVRNWNLEGEIVMVSDWENRDSVPVQAGVGITKTMAPRTDDTIEHFPLPQVAGEWTEYYRNIARVIREGAAPIVTHDQQRRLIRLVEAIFASGASGQVVPFNDVI
ncbi:MAG: Gfo/Idh/MocA family oxidoreductase [Oscillospiraceae bacterium]|nr:Gfo/Idh/MocA family oxidoreductase [Oscillospiraceae bacterium]